MITHEPFYRSILGPVLPLYPSGATLTLFKVERDYSTGRDRATLILNTPEFKYTDNTLQSGVGGGWPKVEIFESYLAFMEACIESREYVGACGNPGENADLFPDHVAEWLVDNKGAIESARCYLCDEDGHVLKWLIQE